MYVCVDTRDQIKRINAAVASFEIEFIKMLSPKNMVGDIHWCNN